MRRDMSVATKTRGLSKKVLLASNIVLSLFFGIFLSQSALAICEIEGQRVISSRRTPPDMQEFPSGNPAPSSTAEFENAKKKAIPGNDYYNQIVANIGLYRSGSSYSPGYSQSFIESLGAFKNCLADEYEKLKLEIDARSAKSEKSPKKGPPPGSSQSEDGLKGQRKPGDQNEKSIAYGPNRKKSCLRSGMSADGYITYTNVCKVAVEFGYCNVFGKDEHDGTVCKPADSAFSRTKVNYITQSGGLAPGRTHTMAYRYEKGQTTFMVACPQEKKDGGFPLIESFDTPEVTSVSKAASACWHFVYKDNTK